MVTSIGSTAQAQDSLPAQHKDTQRSGWQAHLKLEFDHDGVRTRLRRKGSAGPLYVQKPFYPEGDVCHLYLLHPPGGVAGGDELRFSAAVKRGAHVLITNPAATKFLRSNDKLASQQQEICVASGGVAEWLPQETIVFNEAQALNQTRVRLDSGATFLGCEVTSLGRPANEELFASGYYTGVVRLERYCPTTNRYRLVFLDHQKFSGSSTALERGWGLAGKPVFGMMVATPIDNDQLDAFRQAVAHAQLPVQATLIEDVLVIRCLGESTPTVLGHLRSCWSTVRPIMMQRAARSPDIWRT